MKRILILALAATLVASAIGQTRSPRDILKDINEFQSKGYEQARASQDAAAYKKVQDEVAQMARDAIKGVDATKINPKDAYDWAVIYAMVDEHQAVCDLTHVYLSTNPAPEQRFKDQMLMMKSCNALGEADMLKETLTSAKPVTDSDNLQFAYRATDYVDTIAAKKGSEQGLLVLDQIERELKLPDPEQTATDRVARERKPTDDVHMPAAAAAESQKLDRYEDEAMGTNQSVAFGFANERAKLLQDEGQTDKAVAVLDKFDKTPDLQPNVKHMANMTLQQYKLSGQPEVALKTDKTIGTFAGLDSLKGKVVLLDFFAHWCGPCMASVPSMVSMYSELHPKGLEIVGITQFYGFFGAEQKLQPDQEFSKLQGLVGEKNMTWPIVVGPKDNSSAYGVWGIPETVLIDKKGLVSRIWVGYDPSQEEQIRQATEKLLKE